MPRWWQDVREGDVVVLLIAFIGRMNCGLTGMAGEYQEDVIIDRQSQLC